MGPAAIGAPAAAPEPVDPLTSVLRRFIDVRPAESRALAEDAVELVEVDWELLSPACDLAGALAPGGVLAIWSAAPDPKFTRRLQDVGFEVEEVEVRARFLRRGRNASWVSAEVSNAAGVGLTATFVFMGAVESALHLHHVPPPAGLIPVEQAKPRMRKQRVQIEQRLDLFPAIGAVVHL